MGVTSARPHSVGNVPVVIETLNKCVSSLQSTVKASFSYLLLISIYAEDLEVFISLTSLQTSYSVTFN